MRFMAMDATGVRPGPFNSIDPRHFRSIMEGLVERYEADPSLSWDYTADQSGTAQPFGSPWYRPIRLIYDALGACLQSGFSCALMAGSRGTSTGSYFPASRGQLVLGGLCRSGW